MSILEKINTMEKYYVPRSKYIYTNKGIQIRKFERDMWLYLIEYTKEVLGK